MTFDEWWDTTKAAATPETFAGWEHSCRQAWNAGLTAALADRDRAIAEAVAVEREVWRKDAELLAWVLTHPETAAECLEDAAAGDGTARSNLERRIDGIALSAAIRARSGAKG